jgi:hypothetical protein
MVGAYCRNSAGVENELGVQERPRQRFEGRAEAEESNLAREVMFR